MGFDALGKGVGTDEPKLPASVPAQKFMSSGFVRKQNLSNVVVMPKGITSAASPAHALQMRAAESVGSLALADVQMPIVNYQLRTSRHAGHRSAGPGPHERL